MERIYNFLNKEQSIGNWLIYYCQIDSLNMTEPNRRPLRTNRKSLNYLTNQGNVVHLQEEECEGKGNMRYRPSKQSNHTTLPISALAKLLSKFIDSANLNLRNARKPLQALNPQRQKKYEQDHNTKPPKIQKNTPEHPKNIPHPPKDHQEQSSKKSKQLYSFKGQHYNMDPSKNSIRVEAPKHKLNLKQEIPFGINIPNMALQYYPYFNQMNLSKGQYPGGIKYNIPYPLQFALQGGNVPNLITGKMDYGEKQRKVQKQIEKNDLASDKKLFKRSSFHVAIAYHIYIKKLKASGRELNANDIDPTSIAKKLIGEKACDNNNK